MVPAISAVTPSAITAQMKRRKGPIRRISMRWKPLLLQFPAYRACASSRASKGAAGREGGRPIGLSLTLLRPILLSMTRRGSALTS